MRRPWIAVLRQIKIQTTWLQQPWCLTYSNPLRENPGNELSTSSIKQLYLIILIISHSGFLQKPQTVTIYVDLANVGSLHRDLIQVDYGRRSLNIVINNLNGRTYELNLPNLGGDIVPEKCKHKVGLLTRTGSVLRRWRINCLSLQVKPNTITVILKKAQDGDWAGISATEVREKRARDEKTRLCLNWNSWFYFNVASFQ